MKIERQKSVQIIVRLVALQNVNQKVKFVYGDDTTMKRKVCALSGRPRRALSISIVITAIRYGKRMRKNARIGAARLV